MIQRVRAAATGLGAGCGDVMIEERADPWIVEAAFRDGHGAAPAPRDGYVCIDTSGCACRPDNAAPSEQIVR
jgi:hypothetical protein